MRPEDDLTPVRARISRREMLQAGAAAAIGVGLTASPAAASRSMP